MTDTKHTFPKDLVRMGSMLLATLLMIVGIVITSQSSGSSQFMFGVIVVGIGFVLVSLVLDYVKGVR